MDNFRSRDPTTEAVMAERKQGGGMTVQEAGRKGGERVSQSRGRSFYEEIGKKGGRTVARERGHEFYEEIGRKGGEAVKASRGPGFYSEIGHKGGQRVRELIAEAKRRASRTPEPVKH
jgi:general stress protein YciG